jgi:uncharacterized membrane protein YebE (DUF533 family)
MTGPDHYSEAVRLSTDEQFQHRTNREIALATVAAALAVADEVRRLREQIAETGALVSVGRLHAEGGAS